MQQIMAYQSEQRGTSISIFHFLKQWKYQFLFHF